MGVAEDFAPSFTQKPQLRQEDEGNRLVFECKVNSSPKPEVTWFRSETKLVEDNRTAIKVQPIGTNLFLVVLELDDVIESDAGLYKVKAKNKLGEVAASINLNFSPVDEPRERQIDGIAPTFSKKPTIRQEDDGKRLLFECRIQADPRPTVTWSHSGIEVKQDARHKLILENDGHSYFATLEIENVTVEDAGKYKVMAKNELGESNATISLNFDSDEAPVPENGIKPTFTERPLIRQSDSGSEITIECRLVGEPKPSVIWYQGDKIIKETNRVKLLLELDQKLYYLAKLVIKDIKNSDGGVYRVIASNKHGEATATVNLNFEGGDKPKIQDAKPPRFPKKPTIHQEGDILVMECLLEANPVPDIIWYQGDTVILDSTRIRMSKRATGKDQYLLKLEISKPTSQDGGNYRCNACNAYGESNANIALNFQGGDDGAGFAPSFTEKPRIIPNDSGTLITMKCTCTAKPRPEVTWLKGTKVVQENSRVSMKVEEREDTYILMLEIKDPIGPDSGTYKCHVKNEFGESNANLNLNIEAETEPEGTAPTFIEKPKIRSEQNGKLVVMDFRVKADPKPDIIWFHEGKSLKETSKLSWKMEEKENTYYIRLELKDPGIQDSGVYKCNIKNICGELNANLTLNIEVIPVIKEAPKTVTISKTNTVVIECRIQSVFEPKCVWFKGATTLKEDSTHKVNVSHVKEGEYAVKLEINPASPADKGTYKLVAKNEKGETQTTIDVILPPSVEPPAFAQKLTDATTVEGQTTRFVCSFVSVEKSLKIVWYKDGSVVRESDVVSTQFDGKTATLIISSTKKDSAGSYKVTATNTGGTVESSASLKVTEKLKEPEDEEEEEEVKEVK
ncbi:muscle M-line assembly protein unc-89-like [Cimex lectularius]|uniref:Ig-like domain-containing protein n=1 Tax=Cimex lectularius TaxID=79782 RepID=A0A8I6SVK2_CIMLE|nr:muscle M-line assembly protein unc-89-like [Cimex lectularius]